MQFFSHSEQETLKLGRHLAKHLKKSDIVCLFGELGTGKTALVKGIVQGLGINPHKVNSPTFVLLNVYEGRMPVYHFDLYRINDRKEILNLGYEEYFYGEGVSLVEWADRLGKLLPRNYLSIELKHKEECTRLITISAQGKHRGLFQM